MAPKHKQKSLIFNQVTIYMTDLNYTTELKSVDNMVSELENLPDIVNSVDSWLPEMKTFFNEDIGLIEDRGNITHIIRIGSDISIKSLKRKNLTSTTFAI